MTTDLNKEIRHLFARAALHNEASRGLSGDGWAAYQKIHADHAADVRHQERLFLAEYQSRFEVARLEVIKRGGTWDKKLAPRWAGRDKFDAAVIDRQADREVRQAHDALLDSMRRQRDASLLTLFDPARSEQGTRGTAVIDFSKAADRRSGPDRRGPSR